MHLVTNNSAANSNLINNAAFNADRLNISKDDIICCPPPLFHRFSLVMGFLCAFASDCTIVYHCQRFDADLVVQALDDERCTVLYGVPTMFGAELDALAKRGRKLTGMRIALAAGAPVPRMIVERLRQEMGITDVISLTA